MRKDLCDICVGELIEPKKEEGLASFLFSSASIFRIKAVYKIIGITIQIPFGAHRKDIDMCDRCMTDFKEFVQRKQSYHAGDKK